MIVLLFIQNNSKFKNKLKHAYLGRCNVSCLPFSASRQVWKIKGCSKWQMSSVELHSCCSCYVLGRNSVISSSGNEWNVLPFCTVLPSSPGLLDYQSTFLTIMLNYCRHFPHIANIFQIWTTLARVMKKYPWNLSQSETEKHFAWIIKYFYIRPLALVTELDMNKRLNIVLERLP